MHKQFFIAYPNKENIKDSICIFCDIVDENKTAIVIPWEIMDHAGHNIPDTIRQRIENCDGLIADITYPNQNVFYEIGFAISKGKPIIPILNDAVSSGISSLVHFGIFDTTHVVFYQNAKSLHEKIKKKLTEGDELLNLSQYTSEFDKKTPVFLAIPEVRPDYIIKVNSAVKATIQIFSHLMGPRQIDIPL